MSIMKFGIDISKWQKGIDFDEIVKEGVTFVMLRAWHTNKDECFENFYLEAKARALNVGAYIYITGTTEAKALQEVENAYNNALKGKQFEYPIALDIEEKTLLNTGKANVTNIIIACAEYLESKGFYVSIYSSRSYFSSYMYNNLLSAYDKWVAEWNTSCKYKGDYGMWQFGGETNLIRSNRIADKIVDQNYAYIDYPTIMKKNCLNGFSATIYYPKVSYKGTSLVDALKSINVDSSYMNRTLIAKINGITNYSGTADQNIELLNKLKKGTLIRSN